jgi:hypothetical protein
MARFPPPLLCVPSTVSQLGFFHASRVCMCVCVCVNPIGEASDVYSLSRSHQDQGQKEMRADCLSVHGQTPEFVCASKHIKRDGK